jgi:ATP-dependent DNA ligase
MNLARHADEVALTFKSGQDLQQHFPEVVLRAEFESNECFVLDGEIVVPIGAQSPFATFCSASMPQRAAQKN